MTIIVQPNFVRDREKEGARERGKKERSLRTHEFTLINRY